MEEKHQCVVAFRKPPTGNLAHNPGMCPDWESNWWPFGSQAHAQSTELQQLGLDSILDSFEFIAILMFIVLFFFFLNNSL